MNIDNGNVCVFTLHPNDIDFFEMESKQHWLSEGEKQRAERFRFARHQKEYISGKILLRYLLSLYLETEPNRIAFELNRYGKPYIPGQDIRFNLSHSGGMNVVAIGTSPFIGVDVERVDVEKVDFNVAQRYFSPIEYEFLLDMVAHNRILGFYTLWTLKEAFIKAIGEGLSFPLNKFSFAISGKHISLEFSDETKWSEYYWRYEIISIIDEYLVACCVGANTSKAANVSYYQVIANESYCMKKLEYFALGMGGHGINSNLVRVSG